MKSVNNLKRLMETRKMLRNGCTNAENYLWWFLKKSQFHRLKFRRQHSIERYILDFYCPKYKIAIELDWWIHLAREEYDTIRTETLLTYWVKIIRFDNYDILNNIEVCLEKLYTFISSP